MAPVVGGPVLAALGALTGRRLLAKLGHLPRPRLGRGDGRHRPAQGRSRAPTTTAPRVVALLALAQRFVEEPPEDLRVILLSAGSEESFSEGIKAFGERHFAELPRESTFFLCLESLGSPHLLVLRGEGFLKMREYPPRALALIDGLAEELGIWLYPNLRLHNGTDGLEPLAAGYETAALCGCTDLKQPANYHWSQRPRRERRLRHRRRWHPPHRGRDPPPRRALALTAGHGPCSGHTSATRPVGRVEIRLRGRISRL